MNTLTKTMYIRAQKANYWNKEIKEKDVIDGIHYYIADWAGESEFSWVVYTIEVKHKFKPLTEKEFQTIQIKGLEEYLKEKQLEHYGIENRIRAQIQELLAIPDLSNGYSDVTEGNSNG